MRSNPLFAATVGLALVANSPLLAMPPDFQQALPAFMQSQKSSRGGGSLGKPTQAASNSLVAEVSEKLREAIGSRLYHSSNPFGSIASGLGADQQAAFQTLQAKVGHPLKAVFRPGDWTIMQLRGGVLERVGSRRARAQAGSISELTARRFLSENRALLRLDDPDQELRLESEETDELGRRHLRFSQFFRGSRSGRML